MSIGVTEFTSLSLSLYLCFFLSLPLSRFLYLVAFLYQVFVNAASTKGTPTSPNIVVSELPMNRGILIVGIETDADTRTNIQSWVSLASTFDFIC